MKYLLSLFSLIVYPVKKGHFLVQLSSGQFSLYFSLGGGVGAFPLMLLGGSHSLIPSCSSMTRDAPQRPTITAYHNFIQNVNPSKYCM